LKNTTLGYIEFNNKYLMLYRNIDKKDGSLGKWLGIGGKLEKAEDADTCFIREVLEETGISLTPDKIKRRGIVDFKSAAYTSERMFLYTASVEDDFFDCCNEGSLKWIDKSEILSLPLWEGDHVFLKKLLEDDSFFTLSLVYGGKNGDELSDVINDRLILSDISSYENQKELFMYRDLNENQLKKINEPDLGVFIAETPVVIDRAVSCGFIPESFLCEHHLLFDVCKYDYFDVPLYSASENILKTITGYSMTHGMTRYCFKNIF